MHNYLVLLVYRFSYFYQNLVLLIFDFIILYKIFAIQKVWILMLKLLKTYTIIYCPIDTIMSILNLRD